MDTEYHELVSELDAREVLRYLNSLGIHNISGEVLKCFITDLKKLIKYDLQKNYSSNEGVASQEQERPGLERLHSASTFCSRMRANIRNGVKERCSRECQKIKKPFSLRNIHSAPIVPHLNLKIPHDDKPLRRVCSCHVTQDKTKETLGRTESTAKESRVTTTLSNNLIKVPKLPAKKKSDPVSLYHYYTSLWERYRPCLPGENDWSDLRWHIRQKMAGCITRQSENNIPTHPTKSKTKSTENKQQRNV